MKIIVGTKNPKKAQVVLSIFKNVLDISDIEIATHDAMSKVPEAPHNKETFDGARNRAKECFGIGGADYYVGLESGLADRYGNYFEEAWAVIISSNGIEQVGYSSGLLIPAIVIKRMKAGERHDEIMASFDREFNLPDDNRDTWSRYTGGNISRQISLEESIRNALIQLVPAERSLYRYRESK